MYYHTYILLLIYIFIILFLIYRKISRNIKYNLIKKYYPNSKILTNGTIQSVHINNNRIIKIYYKTDYDYVKLLRKLEIYPPIYKIIKNDKYYIVEEKKLFPIKDYSIIKKYNDFIFKKFNIIFSDNIISNYGIDLKNKIYRLDCEKIDIFFFKNTFDYFLSYIKCRFFYILILIFHLYYLYLYFQLNLHHYFLLIIKFLYKYSL
jgi:hypothetical protein